MKGEEIMSFLKVVFPLVLALLCAGEAMAYTPENLEVKIGNIPSRGKAANIEGQFSVKNTTGVVLVIDYQNKKSAEYSFNVVPSRFVLKPGEATTLRYAGAIRTSGKFEVMFGFKLKTQDGGNAGQFQFPQYFKVQDGIYLISDYKSLYINHQQKSDELGKYFIENNFKGDIPMALDEYKTKRPSIGEMLKLDRGSIDKIPTKSGVEDQRPRPPTRNVIDGVITATENESYIEKTPFNTVDNANYALRGQFSYKGMDGLLHPAFGWRVEALRQGSGGWSVVTSDWVEFDGTWRLNVLSGGNYRFRYIAANRFFSPMDENENIYRWIGPVRNNVSLSHNEGHRYADLDTSDVRGLGEVYNEGMTLWSKLYWDGEINPIRKNTIKLFYPNTSYTCNSSRTTPWSCANSSGKIWLIPEHASRFGVTTHELAHQINYEFWDNKMPNNSGGAHNLFNCYTEGLALSEGFANFMVFWAHQDRSGQPNNGFDFNAETLSASYCIKPSAQNESWVAAAFWDLHDTRADGKDQLWFIHKGSVPAIFLRNGVQHSMKDFHEIYRNRANSNHSVIIDNIFKQNYIID